MRLGIDYSQTLRNVEEGMWSLERQRNLADRGGHAGDSEDLYSSERIEIWQSYFERGVLEAEKFWHPAPDTL